MIWSFVLAAIGIFGIYLAGKKNKFGWLIGFSSQFVWIIYAVATQQYGFIFSAFAYAWVYGLNFRKWNKDESNA